MPESKIRVIAPDVGGGFGGKLQITPEEWVDVVVARQARQAGASTPRPARSRWSPATTAATSGRSSPSPRRRTARSPGSRSSCSPTWAPTSPRRRRRAGARRVDVQLDLQVPRLPVQLPDGAHQQDLGRRLPRRRPARRRPTRSSGSWTSSPPRSASTRSRSARRTGSRTRSSRSPRSPGMTYDSGNYEAATAKAKELFGYDELRAEQQQRRDSNDPVQLGIGVSTFTEMCGLAPSRILGQLSYGAGGWEHADIRMLATGKVEVITGTPRTGRATRRRGARSSPTGSACPSRTSRCCTATPRSRPRAGHLRLPVAGRRRRGAGACRPTRSSRRPSRSPRTCSRPARTTSSSPAAGSRVKGTDKGVGDHRDRARDLRRAQPPRRRRADASTPTPTFDPVNFSFPHGTHLCAMEVDTETGADDDAQVRLRRRHRHDHQPAHRRGPGARRPRAGHRAGAVGGGRVRRPGHPGHGLLRRLHPAHRGRHDQLRHRPHRPRRRRRTRSAPRASARPAPSPPPPRSSTRSSTPCGTSASTTSRCRARPNGSGRRSRPGRTPAT